MECWIRVAIMCLVILTRTLGVTGGEQEADDHACTYFRAIDFNGDCVATYLDYVFEWLRVPLHPDGQGGGLLGDVQRQLQIAVQCLKQFPLTDKDLVQSLLQGGVRLDEFLAIMRAKRNTPAMKTQIEGLVRFLLNVSNEDGDETTMTKKELETIYYVFRIDKSVLDEAFKALDKNGDGVISYDEGVAAGDNYFNGADDEKSSLFVGPVIKCADMCKKPRGCLDPIAGGTSKLTATYGSLGSLSLLHSSIANLPDKACHSANLPILDDLLNALSKLLGDLLSGVLGPLSRY